MADSFIAKRKTYLENGVRPGLALLAERKYDDLVKLLAKSSEQLDQAMIDMHKLVDIQVREAKAEFETTQSQYVMVIGIAIGLLVLGLLFGGMLGLQTIRAIVRPLGRLNEAMMNITAGQTRHPHRGRS